MRILLFSPWPPQHTGIADYAYDLAKGLLRNDVSITVITEASNPKPLKGVEIKNPAWLSQHDPLRYDRIVYQMGNNVSYHLYMIPYIFKLRGVIHLHDIVLHHVMAYLLYANGGQRLYGELLNKWYGPHIVSLVLDLLEHGSTIWNTDAVTEIPLFEEVLQYANTCIVHSNFALNKIHASFPRLECHALPQVYADMQIAKHSRENKLTLGIFGGITPNKRIEVVLRALVKCEDLHDQLALNIVGFVHHECTYLKDLTVELGLEEVVTFHNRVSTEKFSQLMNASDMCISLRYPTMAETSAIVMRALQCAVPVLVNNIGWYAELPDFVQKITPNTHTEIDELASFIRKLCKSTEYLEELTSKTREYARLNLNFDTVAMEYAKILNETQPC